VLVEIDVVNGRKRCENIEQEIAEISRGWEGPVLGEREIEIHEFGRVEAGERKS